MARQRWKGAEGSVSQTLKQVELGILLVAVCLPLGCGRLEAIEYTQEPQNLPVRYPCTLNPATVDAFSRFYVLQCLSAVTKVQVFLKGDYVYSVDGSLFPQDGVSIKLLEPNLPEIVTVYSCQGRVTFAELYYCDEVKVDVFRVAEHAKAELAELGVSSATLSNFTPTFSSTELEYKASAGVGEPFSISAAGKQGVYVGIECADKDRGVDCGLLPQASCRHSTHHNEVWPIRALKAVGEYSYSICAVSSNDPEIMQRYTLTVLVIPLYSSRLSSISIGGPWKLNPDFSDDIWSYRVEVPLSVTHVPISAISQDKQAAITIRYKDHEAPGGRQLPRGAAAADVPMPLNEDLHERKFPTWTQPVTIQVTSADGLDVEAYTVILHHMVSPFCSLKNITPDADTDCVLTPPFSENITSYSCVWWYESEERGRKVAKQFGGIVPHLDDEKCKGCMLMSPDPMRKRKKHLSLNFKEEHKFPWRSGRRWVRRFLYGERHVIPFQVVSADKYTSKTYHVTLKRDCPWWMEAIFTRTVTRISSILAVIMAISNAANLMALAKQLQFLSLTNKIDGVPHMYSDFVEGMRSFNLESFDFLPLHDWFNLPSSDEVLQLKNKTMHYLETQFGIPHSLLYIQYCTAKDQEVNGDLLYPNALLQYSRADAEILIKSLREKKLLGQQEPSLAKLGPTRKLAAFLNKRGNSQSGGFRGQAQQASSEDAEEDESGEEDEEDDSVFANGIEGDREETKEDDAHATRIKINRIELDRETLDAVLQEVLGQENMTKTKLRTAWPELDCEFKPVRTGVETVQLWEHLLEFRSVLESTTGVAIILALLLIGVGTAYYFFVYKLLIEGYQKRPQYLEPGPLLIFICDYCFQPFADSVAVNIFSPAKVILFTWNPGDALVRITSLVGIIAYPFGFLTMVLLELRDLLRRHWVVWNKSFDGYTDPHCRTIRVILPPLTIPAFVPGLYQMFTSHIRSIVPVLNEEGDLLEFDSPMVLNTAIKRQDVKINKDIQATREEMVTKLVQNLDRLKSSSSTDSIEAAGLESERQRLEARKKRRIWPGQLLKESIALLRKSSSVVEKETGKADPPWYTSDLEGPFMTDMDEEFENSTVEELIKKWTFDNKEGKKGRTLIERLESSEKLAMMQWIQQAIRLEKKLLKYNILKVQVLHGRLRPSEPVKSDGNNNAQSARHWLPRKADYFEEPSNPRGHHPSLHEFMSFDEGMEKDYIENAQGQRLVCQDRDGLRYWRIFGGRHPLGWLLPGGWQGGQLQWEAEPDMGWDAQPMSFEGRACYADKWQWLYYDYDQPWMEDEDKEQQVTCCCGMKKKDILLYREFRAWLFSVWKHRVPRRVSAREKHEMRKWLWRQLAPITQLKLKFGYMASSNDKFYKSAESGGRTILDIAEMEFSELWREILTAKPVIEKQIGDELHALVHDELLDYTLMRLEDTYPFTVKEPWMQAVDPPDATEFKVMFDSKTFWKTTGEKELEEYRRENKLVPLGGYWSSPHFLAHADREIGAKRYNMLKPDGSWATIKVSVRMEHVLPVMRYLPGFKVNVPRDCVEMPYRDKYAVVFDKAKEGEHWNYLVERSSILTIVILLAADPGGLECAAIFFTITICEWLYEFRVSWKKNTFLEAALETNVLRLALQWLILVVLLCGQLGMPPILCALTAIFIVAVALLMTNVRTFGGELKFMMAEAKSQVRTVWSKMLHYEQRIKVFLGGKNPFNYEFMHFDQGGDLFCEAADIHIIVPDLGLRFEGEPQLPFRADEEETRAMTISKRLVYYSMPPDGSRAYNSITEHPRFEDDIKSGCCMILNIDQVEFKQTFPRIVATIQCVNHTDSGNSSLSRPSYDSFLMLTKELPNGGMWEPEYDHDTKKLEILAAGWNAKIEKWMDELGAVDTKRTGTHQIQENLSRVLWSECAGSIARNMYKVRIEGLNIPARGSFLCEDLSGKPAYVSILYENDSFRLDQLDFLQNRMSTFAHFKMTDREGRLELTDDIRSEFGIPVPVGINFVRFAVWVQDTETTEELVAFTDKVEVKRLCSTDAEAVWPLEYPEHEVMLHCKWKLHHRNPYPYEDRGQDDEIYHDFSHVRRRNSSNWNNAGENNTDADNAGTSEKSKGNCFSCCYSGAKEDAEEIVSFRGTITVKMRFYTESEANGDMHNMEVVEDMIKGVSVMNLGKLMRHTDEWLMLADVFGIWPLESDLEHLERHAQQMEEVCKRHSNDAELAKAVKNLYRRQLGNRSEMQKAIGRLKRQLVETRSRVLDIRKKNVCVLSQLTTRSISGYVVQDLRTKRRDRAIMDAGLEDNTISRSSEESAAEAWFPHALLDQLRVYQDKRLQASQQVLHYVFMSSQIKQDNRWRPDAIPAHLCSIAARNIADVDEVRIAGFVGTAPLSINFKREVIAQTGRPALVNGRLSFEAPIDAAADIENRWTSTGSKLTDSRQLAATIPGRMQPADKAVATVYLYWDGIMRWVISPRRGEPVPYSENKEDIKGFMWAKDNMATPDDIVQSWHVWNIAAEKWEVNEGLKVRSKRKQTKHETKLLQPFGLVPSLKKDTESEGEEQNGRLCNPLRVACRDFFSEIFSVFSHDSRAIEPEMKDCLVSLNAQRIRFSWKDLQAEKLAPYRKFLLERHGSYHRAWHHMTRYKKIEKNLAARNLAKMCKISHIAIKAMSLAPSRGVARGVTRGISGRSARGEMSNPFPRSKTGVSRGVSTRSVVSRTKSGVSKGGISERSIRVKMRPGQTVNFAEGDTHHEDTGGTTSIADDELDILQEFLRDASTSYNPETRYQELANSVLDALDQENTGFVDATHLRLLYDRTREIDSNLEDFREWLLAHFWYKDEATMWNELSEGGISLNCEDFTESMKTEVVDFLLRTTKQKLHHMLELSSWDGASRVAVKGALWGRGQLQLTCSVSGKEALALYEKKQTWDLRVAGFKEFFSPREAPILRKDEIHGLPEDVQQCTLEYPQVPLHAKIFLRYGRGSAHFEEIGVMPDFVPTPEEKAKRLFEDLDTEMSDCIGLKEIIPSFGDRMEDAGRSLISFDVPLSQVQEIIPEAFKVYGVEKKKCIRLQVQKDYAQSPEWSRLKAALSPSSQKNHEVVSFCMLPAYFDLWNQVSKDSGLQMKQMWVRFYNGAYTEHPRMKGVYMRDGKGTQRWPDGQVYDGNWRNHVYHGIGTLWAKHADWETATRNAAGIAKSTLVASSTVIDLEDRENLAEGNPPIYHGPWEAGARSGPNGELNWRQGHACHVDKSTSFARTTAFTNLHFGGVKKIYTGSFKDGLFNGPGLLETKGASVEEMLVADVGGITHSQTFSQLEPSKILQFEGEFQASWHEVHKIIWQLDPEYRREFVNVYTVAWFADDIRVQHQFFDHLDDASAGFRVKTDSVRACVLIGPVGEEVRSSGDRAACEDLLFWWKEEDAARFLRLEALTKKDMFHQTRRFLRNFGPEAGGVQKAGTAMPDPGLILYQMRINSTQLEIPLRPHQPKEIPGDTLHISYGQAIYSNGCVYDGPFKCGWPDGQDGVLKLYQPDLPDEVAEYVGDWVLGEREGQGRYEIKGCWLYEGSWKDNKRHGRGRQTVEDHRKDVFDYKSYDGEWQEDLPHGSGRMTLWSDWDGEHVYDGEFVKGLRHGRGSEKLKGTKDLEIVLYNGLWRNDAVHATRESPAWAYMFSGDKKGSHFYHGELTADGMRAGQGILFDGKALNDPEFMAVVASTSYRELTMEKKKAYKLYEGQWENNLFHGHGEQLFKEGVYIGQFDKGRRHGQGEWHTSGEKFIYRPIDGETSNWANDKMHGVGIIEDADHVHENIVYNNGKCLMPFTKAGPPTTQFADSRLVGGIVRRAREVREVWASYLNPDAVAGSMDVAGETRLTQRESKGDQALALVETTGGESAAATGSSALALPNAGDFTRMVSKFAEARADNLTLPSMDVLVSGGRGTNEIMNGLYIQMVNTFGWPVYRLVKQGKGRLSMLEASKRYLYQDEDKKYWIIGPRPLERFALNWRNAAVVQDGATHPGAITAAWAVWHESSGQVKDSEDSASMSGLWTLEDEPQPSCWSSCSCSEAPTETRQNTGVDRLTVESVLGFQVTGIFTNRRGIITNFFHRHPGQLYHRPLYEAEAGGQYLYWLPSNADNDLQERVQAGLPGSWQSTEEVKLTSQLFSPPGGCWIIASEVGEQPDGSTCHAWVKDVAATPDLIAKESQWMVAEMDGTERKFRPIPSMRLVMQVASAEMQRKQKTNISRSGWSELPAIEDTRTGRSGWSDQDQDLEGAPLLVTDTV